MEQTPPLRVTFILKERGEEEAEEALVGLGDTGSVGGDRGAFDGDAMVEVFGRGGCGISMSFELAGIDCVVVVVVVVVEIKDGVASQDWLIFDAVSDWKKTSF